MIPSYICIAVLSVLVLALAHLLYIQQRYWLAWHSDVNDRLMSNNWDEYVLNRPKHSILNEAPKTRRGFTDEEEEAVEINEGEVPNSVLGVVR